MPCSLGDDCWYIHEECKTQKEYDQLYKPWEHRKRSTSKTNVAADSATNGGQAAGGQSAAAVNPLADCNFTWEFICKKGLDCPGLKDGTCSKQHVDVQFFGPVIERAKSLGDEGKSKPSRSKSRGKKKGNRDD